MTVRKSGKSGTGPQSTITTPRVTYCHTGTVKTCLHDPTALTFFVDPRLAKSLEAFSICCYTATKPEGCRVGDEKIDAKAVIYVESQTIRVLLYLTSHVCQGCPIQKEGHCPIYLSSIEP